MALVAADDGDALLRIAVGIADAAGEGADQGADGATRRAGILGDGEAECGVGEDWRVVERNHLDGGERAVGLVDPVADLDHHEAIAGVGIVAAVAECNRPDRGLVIGLARAAAQGDGDLAGHAGVDGGGDAGGQGADAQRIARLGVGQHDGCRGEVGAVGIDDQQVAVGDRHGVSVLGVGGPEVGARGGGGVVGVEIELRRASDRGIVVEDGRGAGCAQQVGHGTRDIAGGQGEVLVGFDLAVIDAGDAQLHRQFTGGNGHGTADGRPGGAIVGGHLQRSGVRGVDAEDGRATAQHRGEADVGRGGLVDADGELRSRALDHAGAGHTEGRTVVIQCRAIRCAAGVAGQVNVAFAFVVDGADAGALAAVAGGGYQAEGFVALVNVVLMHGDPYQQLAAARNARRIAGVVGGPNAAVEVFDLGADICAEGGADVGGRQSCVVQGEFDPDACAAGHSEYRVGRAFVDEDVVDRDGVAGTLDGDGQHRGVRQTAAAAVGHRVVEALGQRLAGR
ncbi:hypothetical protein D3C78_421710 [compost metagenome]